MERNEPPPASKTTLSTLVGTGKEEGEGVVGTGKEEDTDKGVGSFL